MEYKGIQKFTTEFKKKNTYIGRFIQMEIRWNLGVFSCLENKRNKYVKLDFFTKLS